MKFTIRLKGGPGSGHFGHKGRPGQEGGSLPRDLSSYGGSYSDLGDMPEIGETIILRLPYEGDVKGKVERITEIDTNRSTPIVHLDTGYFGPLNIAYPADGGSFIGIEKFTLENRILKLKYKNKNYNDEKIQRKVLRELSNMYRDDNNIGRKWTDSEKSRILDVFTGRSNRL